MKRDSRYPIYTPFASSKDVYAFPSPFKSSTLSNTNLYIHHTFKYINYIFVDLFIRTFY